MQVSSVWGRLSVFGAGRQYGLIFFNNMDVAEHPYYCYDSF